jgi:hypothetical protein
VSGSPVPRSLTAVTRTMGISGILFWAVRSRYGTNNNGASGLSKTGDTDAMLESALKIGSWPRRKDGGRGDWSMVNGRV